jgi:hypothetical protein
MTKGNGRAMCSCHPPRRLARCSACLDNQVPGAGSELCPFHWNHSGRGQKHPRRTECAQCVGLGSIARPVRPGPEVFSDRPCMVLCDETFAMANVCRSKKGAKGWEVKKLHDSKRKGYHRIKGRVLQAVSRAGENIPFRYCRRAPPGARRAVTRIGTCPQCRQKFCNSWRLKREVPPPRAGLCTNWVVGSFEFGIYKDIRISREVRPGFAEDSTCPCAFIYDTTPLEELFASWRPPGGRKTRCIQFLAHFAWVDSKNNTVKPGQHPGCLRAHQLVNVRRYAKPQLWGTHAGQSSCPLRRGAQRCDVIAKTRGEMSNDE